MRSPWILLYLDPLDLGVPFVSFLNSVLLQSLSLLLVFLSIWETSVLSLLHLTPSLVATLLTLRLHSWSWCVPKDLDIAETLEWSSPEATWRFTIIIMSKWHLSSFFITHFPLLFPFLINKFFCDLSSSSSSSFRVIKPFVEEGLSLAHGSEGFSPLVFKAWQRERLGP